MKIKIFLLFCIVFFITGNVSYADVYDFPSDIKNISEQLPEIKSINCSFRQEKYLKNISKPVVSGGDFRFVKNDGVYFKTTYPIQASTDYTVKNNRQINDIINAVSSKKYAKIEKDFDFFYTKDKNIWYLGFKPKKSSKAYNFISSITINGGDIINRIEINQTNGNRTVIWFMT